MDGSQRGVRRRALLGGLATGVAAIAGCSSKALSPDDDQTPTDDGTATPTGTATASPEPEGATIPTYPYGETGVEPLDPKPDPDALNPVLKPGHVTDAQANFVADPFLFVTEDDDWHMFFEVATDNGGLISHATSDDRGVTWSYDQVVLQRPYHLSFPYVFEWNGEFYMTTEEGRQNAKPRLYKATEFPTEWTHVTDLYDPTEYDHGITDHVLFRWNDRWWDVVGVDNTDVHVYHSEELTGEWKPHANNPVVEDREEAARPGGRPIVRDDSILMFYQDNVEFYGEKLRAYRIDELTTESYSDSEVPESPVLDGSGEDGRNWNSVRMHHYDPWYLGEGEGWRCAVDGNGTGEESWAIGIYRVPEE